MSALPIPKCQAHETSANGNAVPVPAEWQAFVSPLIRGRHAHCEVCGHDLAPGEAAYKFFRYFGVGITGTINLYAVTACLACLNDAAKRRQVHRYPDLDLHCVPCGRPVFVPWDGRRRPLALCCEQCGVDYAVRRQREARALAPRPCKDCGQTFTPKRKDSIYCSAACKQRAYRKREVRP